MFSSSTKKGEEVEGLVGGLTINRVVVPLVKIAGSRENRRGTGIGVESAEGTMPQERIYGRRDVFTASFPSSRDLFIITRHPRPKAVDRDINDRLPRGDAA